MFDEQWMKWCYYADMLGIILLWSVKKFYFWASLQFIQLKPSITQLNSYAEMCPVVQLLQWLTCGIYSQAFSDGTELYNRGGFLQFVVKTVLKSRKLNLCEHTFDCNFQSDHQLMNWNYTVTKKSVLGFNFLFFYIFIFYNVMFIFVFTVLSI